MNIGLLGQKLGMTQLFTEQGEVIPVTVIKAGPCCVLQVKTADNDGYEAIQLGFKDKPRRLARKSERGHVAKIDSKRQKKMTAEGVELRKKANCEPQRFVREFRVPVEGVEVGQNFTVDVFNDTIAVDVSSKSKGRGYSGAMRRHNFSGQRATHGVKKCHRHLGSTGCSAYPSRTPKGKRMPGQYGNKNCTIRNQKVVLVDAENNILAIRGAVPGAIGAYVVVKPTNRLPAPKQNKWRLA
ncbi:MAG: 50S ribosomal protein L3 [Planctomycetia bacterium]|nr:50S ribosomal protein L3 [Planctomycetia bacterium]